MHEETSYEKAGYYLQYLQNLRAELEKTSAMDIGWTIDRLCSFSLRRINFEGIKSFHPPDDWKQLLSVYHNLVIRGLPTYPTLEVERFLLDSVSKTVSTAETDDKNNVAFRDRLSGIIREAWLKSLARAHAALDPHFGAFQKDMDSTEEHDFFEALSRNYGPSIYQLIECQRPFSSIVQADDAKVFFDQRVDFSLETKGTKIILEIDGMQHQEPNQKALDEKRDQFLKANNWEVVRIPARDVRQERIADEIQSLAERFATDTFLLAATRNISQPLDTHDVGRAALHLVVTPFSLARLEYTIVWAFLTGCLDIRKPHLRIAVIEWDLPCVFLAFWDFVKSFNHLRSLAGLAQTLPKIDLEIFRKSQYGLADGINSLTPAFGITAHVSNDVESVRRGRFDMIISVSTLQVGSRDLSGVIGQNPCIAIDSVHGPRGPSPQIESAYPVRYLVSQEPNENLDFFLKWIFRKRRFREGQFEMVRRSLALEDLIALLPTSAGKSLCYQLSALLQPGTTLVVDPLISLMTDQMDNLKDFQIDFTGHVSSDQKRAKQDETLQRLVHRNLLILFVSPERLQIPTFREALEFLCQTTPVPFLVIDEAHCISEWGHDFRPSYLKLADNARTSCTYHDFQPRIIALTGTACSAVLDDIQRVIGLSDNAMVTPETFDRPELEYEVTKCTSDKKWSTLKEQILELPRRFNKASDKFFNPTNAGIVFCPHVGSIYGIVRVATDIGKELRNVISDVRMYSGKPPKGYSREEWKQLKADNQNDFKENKTTLVVATKAFGMGIDKPNIRFTIHYNMPTSLEQFYQESGRAGRDGSKALCTLIFSGDYDKWKDFLDPTKTTNEKLAHEIDSTLRKDDIYRMLYFHSKSWQGIEDEFNRIKKLITSTIEPEIQRLKYDETGLVRISFGGEIVDDEDGGSSKRIEKMLYRLSILGLVADYSLDHRARMFEVEVVRRRDDFFKSVLLDYLSEYKSGDFSEAIEKAQGSTMLDKCLRTLLEFVYREIEGKRREAIRQMAQVANKSPSNETFRRELLHYLETSERSQKLNKMAKEMEPQEWLDVMSNIEDINSAQRLLGNCRRALESYPDHPGLLLLSSYARLKTSDETAVDEFERATRSLVRSPLKDSAQEQTLAKAIGLMAMERPDALPALCYAALLEFPRREIARVTLTYVQISSQAGRLALRVLLTYVLEEVKSVGNHILGGERV
jgi:ATP-dependent DNA helicase RecQ